ncbi:hypothetical protein DENSPDRAFT_630311 [Dentipellis sp. KUC8613]|nr:hypothetical protein DENSPDRAFT_630311 [Dentipellis sp. KUC8613]
MLPLSDRPSPADQGYSRGRKARGHTFPHRGFNGVQGPHSGIFGGGTLNSRVERSGYKHVFVARAARPCPHTTRSSTPPRHHTSEPLRTYILSLSFDPCNLVWGSRPDSGSSPCLGAQALAKEHLTTIDDSNFKIIYSKLYPVTLGTTGGGGTGFIAHVKSYRVMYSHRLIYSKKKKKKKKRY